MGRLKEQRERRSESLAKKRAIRQVRSCLRKTSCHNPHLKSPPPIGHINVENLSMARLGIASEQAGHKRLPASLDEALTVQALSAASECS